MKEKQCLMHHFKDSRGAAQVQQQSDTNTSSIPRLYFSTVLVVLVHDVRELCSCYLHPLGTSEQLIEGQARTALFVPTSRLASVLLLFYVLQDHV
jgi:hypothetical protein